MFIFLAISHIIKKQYTPNGLKILTLFKVNIKNKKRSVIYLLNTLKISID